MERGIVVVDGRKVAVDGDFSFQFLAYLATQSLLGCLSWFYLSAGELPPVLELAIATLCGEILATAFYHGSHYIYCLHHSSHVSVSATAYTAFMNFAMAGFRNSRQIATVSALCRRTSAPLRGDACCISRHEYSPRHISAPCAPCILSIRAARA